MPNWTYNVLSAKGIGKMDIFEEEGGRKVLSFNKIIPMPDYLEKTVSPLPRNCIFLYLLKNGATIKNVAKECKKYGELPHLNTYDAETKKNKDKLVNALEGEKPPFTDLSLYEMGELAVKAYNETGFTNWYDWRIAKWGTKWEPDTLCVNSDEIVFNAAWSQPIPIIIALANRHPGIEFVNRATYEDDDGYDYLSLWTVKDGALLHKEWQELVRNIECEEDEEYE